MTDHPTVDFQILLDSASQYILAHAAGAGVQVLPPVWDEGVPDIETSLHSLRIATHDAYEELPIPHQWLAVDSEGHNRFRTEVEAALARLRTSRRART
jgi:hypothetical protein